MKSSELPKSPVNVLFLDDEAELCEIFQDIFNGPEIKIHTFNKIDEALKAASTTLFDLAFIDLNLGRHRGEEIANLLPPELPKYLLTGEVEPSLTRAFDDIIEKPINLKKIHGILKKFLDQKSSSGLE